MTQCGEGWGWGRRRHALPALPVDGKLLSLGTARVLGALTADGRREAGQRAGALGSLPPGKGPCGDEASRSCSGHLKSEAVHRLVFCFPSSSSSSFPQEGKNWEVELGLPQGPGRVTRVQGAGPHLAAERTSRSWRGRRTRPQTSLLDLYFNFRKELRKHALESQEGDKS